MLPWQRSWNSSSFSRMYTVKKFLRNTSKNWSQVKGMSRVSFLRRHQCSTSSVNMKTSKRTFCSFISLRIVKSFLICMIQASATIRFGPPSKDRGFSLQDSDMLLKIVWAGFGWSSTGWGQSLLWVRLWPTTTVRPYIVWNNLVNSTLVGASQI